MSVQHPTARLSNFLLGQIPDVSVDYVTDQVRVNFRRSHVHLSAVELTNACQIHVSC